MNKEDVLNQFEPNREYPSYYHESNVLSAMDKWAEIKSAAEVSRVMGELVKWMEEKELQMDSENFYTTIESCIQKAKEIMEQQSLNNKTENNEQ